MRRLAILLVGVLVVAGCAGDDDEAAAPQPARITVHGSGTVRADPDLLTVVLGVETRAPKATDALADNNRRAAALFEELRRRGVGEDDLQTSHVSVNPDYDQRGRIVGFVVDNAVTARLRELEKAGELLDAVASAVGDAIRLQSFQYSIDDPTTAAADARADAVGRARRQAEQLARAAGVRLGRLRSLRETPVSRTFDEYSVRDLATAAGASAGAVPLAGGTLEVQIDVDLVYDVAG